MWVLTIHCSFRLSPVVLLVGISGIPCAQPTIFPTLKTCKAMAAGAFLTCTNFETGSKLPEFSGIVVTARANQYLVLATVPVLDPAGFIGLRGNGLTPSKIDDFLSESSL
jgi:hypothetical protein